MIARHKIITEYLHIFVLTSFALSQPVYDLLGKYPEFFIAHRASPFLILSMIFILSVGIALVFILIEMAVLMIEKRARNYVHLLFLFGLALLAALPLAHGIIRAFDFLIVMMAIIFALLFTLLYAHWEPVRTLLSFMAPVVLIFPLWFLWSTPVGGYVMPHTTKINSDSNQNGSSHIEIKNPVPIVLVVFDEFSTATLLDAENKIDTVRYPNIARLASESRWFPNAVGPTVDTALAVPAIMTGKQPDPNNKLVPTADDYPYSIFSLLGSQYHLNVFESMTAVCPDALCSEIKGLPHVHRYVEFFADIAVIYLHVIAPPGLGSHLPTLDGQWTGFGLEFFGFDLSKNDRELNKKYTFDQFQKHKHIDYFLSNIRKNGKPSLHFFHVALPHIPYWYLSSGHQYSDERKLPDGIISDKVGWIGEDPLILTAYHQYLQQVGYVDRFVGNLLDTLHREELYDKALIIVTADHGVSFQSGKSRRLSSEDTANEIIKVPMILKLPEQREGQIDGRLVSGIDVLPTVIDVLGVTVDWEIDGISMLNDNIRSRDEINIPLVGNLTVEKLRGFSRLEWQIEYFGTHTSLDQLVPKGPYEELRKKELASLNVGPAALQRFISEDVDLFLNVDPQSGYLPAQFKGYIKGLSDTNRALAIALNGRIWATTKTSNWNGKKNYFNVLIPPSAFKNGHNEIDLFLIREEGGQLLLSPLGDGRKHIRLDRNHSGKVAIHLPNDQIVNVGADPEIMKGSLDWVSFDGKKLYFEGWAADIKEKQQVKSIYIFVEDRLIAQIEPNYERKGVNELFQLDPSLLSGFRGGFPLKALRSDPKAIKVIVLGKNKIAYELPLREKHDMYIQSLVSQGVANQ